MSDHDHFERTADSRPSRQVKHRISLSSVQESEIIDDLTTTIDELRIFAAPMTTVRALSSVALNLGADSRLPSTYSNLSLTQATIEGGTYVTKLSLPGQTLRLEGADSTQAGLWRVTSGNRELAAYEHTDLVAHLCSILPPNTLLDELADTVDITDKAITDQLWQSLSPLSDSWYDSRQYLASDYAFSLAYDPRTEDYFNEVGAGLGYVEGQSADGQYKRYTSRISTQRPINLSWSSQSSANRPATVDQEFYFEVLYPEKIEEMRTTLAHLALESIVISSSRLADLARTTVLHLDDPTAIYHRTNSLVRSAHLDKDSVN
jgi:hypothetical protein